MIKINNKEAFTDSPDKFKIYRVKDEDTYFTRCTLLKGESEKDFKEIPIEEYNKIIEEQEKLWNI